MLQFAQRDLARADASLRKALECDPKSAAALTLFGNVHGARGELAASKESLRRGAELSPLRSPRQLHYIEFLRRTGAKDEAKTLITELTKRAPDFIPGITLDMRVAGCSGQRSSCIRVS